MTEFIRKTEAFIREKFLNTGNNDTFDWKYRYEHSLRVAGIGQRIAREEGMDEEALIIGGLLHDIGYVECKSKEDHDVHGRISARIAREFLTSINYDPEKTETVCYGIKIHTEPVEDYERKPTAFEDSIADADNIDRFDAYRLYLALDYNKLENMTPDQMIETSNQTIERYERYVKSEFATGTATAMWREIISLQLGYYKRLKTQMEDMKSFCETI